MDWADRLKKLLEERLKKPVNRRTFLKGALATGGVAAVAKASSEVLHPSPYITDRYTWEKFFQKH